MQLNFSLPYREHDTACAVYVGKMLPPFFKMFSIRSKWGWEMPGKNCHVTLTQSKGMPRLVKVKMKFCPCAQALYHENLLGIGHLGLCFQLLYPAGNSLWHTLILEHLRFREKP